VVWLHNPLHRRQSDAAGGQEAGVMENARYTSLRLLAAALLMFGGLLAIAAGLIVAVAPLAPPACAPGMECTSKPAVPPIADGLRRALTN
jgi:hypothetical protein